MRPKARTAKPMASAGGAEKRVVPVAAGVVVALVAACSGPLDRAQRLDASGRDFNSRLAFDYRDYAIYEAEAMKNDDRARLFARKALDASAGKAVPPEDPNARKIKNPEARIELQAAHSRLTSALMGGAAAKAPAAAARAQVSFDCWVAQQETGWLAHIQGCRDGFTTAISRVEDAARPARATTAPPGSGGSSSGVERVPLQ